MGLVVGVLAGASTPVVIAAGAADVAVAAGAIGVQNLLSSCATERKQPPHAPGAEDSDEYPLPDFLVNAGYESTINIGIVGPSGVGKSSFINALRRVRPGQSGAAPVGCTETTLSPQMYTFSADVDGLNTTTLRDVRLWDLPGGGTHLFPRDTYVRDVGLRYFDVVVILSSQRITEVDLLLIEKLREFGVPHLAVRSKIDADIANEEADYGRSEEDTLGRLRDDMKEQGFEDPYLISSRDSSKYDYPRLVSSIWALVVTRRRVRQSEQDCPICFEQFYSQAESQQREPVPCPRCGNAVCSVCISSLRSSSTERVTCPFCRETCLLEYEDVHD